MYEKIGRFVSGTVVLCGLWFGGCLTGRLLFPDSDAMIIPGVIGMVVGVNFAVKIWFDWKTE